MTFQIQSVNEIVAELRSAGIDHANLEQLVGTLSDGSSKFMGILGRVQSGKTRAMIISCITAVKRGLIPLVILRNATCDAAQFLANFNEQLKKINEYSDFDFDFEIEFESETDTESETETDIESVTDTDSIFLKEIRDVVTFETNTVYYTIGNHHQLNDFVEKMYDDVDFPKEKLVILLDESDELFYNNDENPKQVQETISKIRENCFKFIPVTATFDVVLKAEINARLCDIFVIPKPLIYKGIDSVSFIINDILSTKRTAIIDVVLDEIFRRRTGYIKLTLVNTISKINEQKKFIMNASTLKRTIRGGGKKYMVYMCMNCKGYDIRTGFKIDERHDDKLKIFKLQEQEGTYLYRVSEKVELTKILSAFEIINSKMKRQKKKIDTIVLLCARMAGRGLSFVSESRKTHITDLICNEKTDLAAAYQSMRIFGNFVGMREMNIHCPQKLAIDIKTICKKNENAYDYLENKDNERRMPIELLRDHLDRIEYPSNVIVNDRECTSSRKRLCSKIKGNLQARKQGVSGYRVDHCHGDESLEQAVARVYGHGKNTVNTTETFNLSGHYDVHENMTSDEKKNLKTAVREAVREQLDLETRQRLGLETNYGLTVAYTGSHRISFYKHPMVMSVRHITNAYFNDGILTVRTCDIKDLTIEDRTVYTWHDCNGKLAFGQTVKIEEIAVESDKVIECDY